MVMRRWAAADDDAERVLADEQSLLRIGASMRWSLTLGLVAVVVAAVGFVVLPGDGRSRFVVMVIIVVAAILSVILRTVQGARARGRTGTAYPTVTTVLTARERHAVNRAVGGRGPAPIDRRRIVRATAVLRADLLRVEQPIWYAALWAGLALGYPSPGSVMVVLSFVSAVLGLIASVVPLVDVVRVRRSLRATPAPWDVDAPAASV
jgi:hypothetical protein